MGHLTPRWRRVWGIRPGELRRPLRMLGRRRVMGEPQSGSRGRGWLQQHGVLRRRPPSEPE